MSRSLHALSILMVLGLGCVLAEGTTSSVKQKAREEKRAPSAKRPPEPGQEIRQKLEQPSPLERGIDHDTPLSDAIEYLSSRHDVPILINHQTFAAVGVQDIEMARVWLPRMLGMKLSTVLKLLVDQVNGAYLVHPGFVEITSRERAWPEAWTPDHRDLAVTVNGDFDNVPLREALRRLSSDSGITVLVEESNRDTATAPVTATLDNVPLDTAVRLLASMAGLRLAVIDNVLYVTTPENADRLQAEQEARHKAAAGGM